MVILRTWRYGAKTSKPSAHLLQGGVGDLEVQPVGAGPRPGAPPTRGSPAAGRGWRSRPMASSRAASWSRGDSRVGHGDRSAGGGGPVDQPDDPVGGDPGRRQVGAVDEGLQAWPAWLRPPR